MSTAAVLFWLISYQLAFEGDIANYRASESFACLVRRIRS